MRKITAVRPSGHRIRSKGEVKVSAILKDNVASRYKVEDLVRSQDEHLIVRALKCLVLEGRLSLLTLTPATQRGILGYFRKKKALAHDKSSRYPMRGPGRERSKHPII